MVEKFGDDAPWWYVGDDENDRTSEGNQKNPGVTRARVTGGSQVGGPVLRSGVPSEPSEVFEARMKDLKEWLERRPESHIAIVAHWGVWFSLTGREFENCELVTLELDDLEPGKGKMPV
jgi:hypothetical protein